MVGHDEQIVAQRYTRAFLALHTTPFSEVECHALGRIIEYYQAMPTLLFYLQMPLFSFAEKRAALARARTYYQLPYALEKLDLLLLEQGRIFLLPRVYQELIKQSDRLAGRMPCTVTSAVPLSESERQLSTDFAAKAAKTKPLITWQVDPSLIAGIRFQAENWLWEDSLDARLKALANTLLI